MENNSIVVEFIDSHNLNELYNCSNFIKSTTCKDYYTLLDIAEGRINDKFEWKKDFSESLIKTLVKEENNIRVIKAFFSGINETITIAIIKINKDEKYIEISDIVTADKYRRKGIGNEMIKFIERFAKENNISKIGLASSINNIKAHQFFQKYGYEKVAYEYVKRI